MGPTEVTCWHEINCITISVTAILVIRIAVGLRSANHHQQDRLGQDLHCHDDHRHHRHHRHGHCSRRDFAMVLAGLIMTLRTLV